MNTDNKSQNKRPDFLAYNVKNNGKENDWWTQLGAAWRHADSEGFTIILDAIPVDGRIVLRKFKAEEQAQAEPSFN